MNLTLHANRSLIPATHLLCALFLFILAMPMCHAAGGAPVVSANVSPAALPVTGGVITFSATVTSPTGQTIANVYADWNAGGGYNGRVSLSSGSNSNVYSGSFHTNGSNTTSAAYIFTSVVTASNDLNLSNSATVAGQTVQEDSLGTVPPLTAGLTHIAWTNADGRLSLRNYDPLSGGFSQITYGPYAGWSAKAVADGPDGKTRVLWDKIDGTMSLWNLDNTTGLFTQNSFGPYPGWTATSLSVGP